jgi:hypothetical protein
LGRIHTLGAACATELHDTLEQWDELDDAGGALANLLGTQLDDPADLYVKPIMDSAAMTVTWHGRTCRLGPSILFRLMAGLARRPGDYIAVDRLRHDVWQGNHVSDEAMRAAVKRLKGRLVEAGMGELAAGIRSDMRHYGLHLDHGR